MAPASNRVASQPARHTHGSANVGLCGQRLPASSLSFSPHLLSFLVSFLLSYSGYFRSLFLPLSILLPLRVPSSLAPLPPRAVRFQEAWRSCRSLALSPVTKKEARRRVFLLSFVVTPPRSFDTILLERAVTSPPPSSPHPLPAYPVRLLLSLNGPHDNSVVFRYWRCVSAVFRVFSLSRSLLSSVQCQTSTVAVWPNNSTELSASMRLI